MKNICKTISTWSKKKKIGMSVVAFFVILCIIAAIVVPVEFCIVVGEASEIMWQPTDTFSTDCAAATLRKDPNKDFVIVNFADMQADLPSDFAKTGEIYKTIKKVVDQTHPDLITLSGDNAWFPPTRQSYKAICNMLDSFEIAWTFAFGNHDHQGNADLECLIDIVQAESKYAITNKGPRSVDGVGNIFINVVEKQGNGLDKIVHTVFMLDSGDSGVQYTDEQKAQCYDYNFLTQSDINTVKTNAANLKDQYFKDCTMDFDDYPYLGKIQKDKNGNDVCSVATSYDGITYSQVEWYKWVLEGNKQVNVNNGFTVDPMPESTCVFHIPFYQYYTAYKTWLQAIENNDTATLTEMAAVGRMRYNETSGCTGMNNGLFDAMVTLGSTKNVITGHDHVNDFSLVYQGIRLTYGVKTGNECYWTNDGTMNGGTKITLGNGGNYTKLEQIYIDDYAK